MRIDGDPGDQRRDEPIVVNNKCHGWPALDTADRLDTGHIDAKARGQRVEVQKQPNIDDAPTVFQPKRAIKDEAAALTITDLMMRRRLLGLHRSEREHSQI